MRREATVDPNPSDRAAGTTNVLAHGASREAAQRIAVHADRRTTKLYDRRAELTRSGGTTASSGWTFWWQALNWLCR